MRGGQLAPSALPELGQKKAILVFTSANIKSAPFFKTAAEDLSNNLNTINEGDEIHGDVPKFLQGTSNY